MKKKNQISVDTRSFLAVIDANNKVISFLLCAVKCRIGSAKYQLATGQLRKQEVLQPQQSGGLSSRSPPCGNQVNYRPVVRHQPIQLGKEWYVWAWPAVYKNIRRQKNK